MPKRNKADDLADTGQPRRAVQDNDTEDRDGGGVIDSAKQAASHLVDQVKEQATSHADQQRHTVASGLNAVADAFRSMGDDL